MRCHLILVRFKTFQSPFIENSDMNLIGRILVFFLLNIQTFHEFLYCTVRKIKLNGLVFNTNFLLV